MPEREGVIRFSADHRWEPLPESLAPLVAELAHWQVELRRLGVVGRDPDRYGGYAFGNLSACLEAGAAPGSRSFLITGSQTMQPGDEDQAASLDRWTVVERWDAAANRVESRGPVAPSSESLSHGALYDLDLPTPLGAVFHAHAPDLWHRAAALNLPTTAPTAECGTPALAQEIARLGREGHLTRGLLAMGGHEDGILAFGPTPREAGERLREALTGAAQSILGLRGLGKEIWRDIDPADHIRRERESWD